jgi:lysozyme
MALIPSNRPQITKEELLRQVAAKFPDFKPGDNLWFCGVRGYYKKTMGDPSGNDRGIYDDAIFIISPNVFASYNANTDPSVYRKQTRTRKGIAVLQPGVWPVYAFDTHNGSRPHPAICQRRGEVTVKRDGGVLDTGWFGINIHRGGINGTSSEGCQTFPPSQWPAFYAAAKAEVIRLYGQDFAKETFTYVLIEN